jgi:hypothetical protein
MNMLDLFKSNGKDSKPLESRTSSSKPNQLNASAPVPIHQLFSMNHSKPVVVNQEKNVNVPSNESASDLDQVRSLNVKYIQVINQINEELTKLKSDATKTTAENASLKKENNELSNKVSELSKAVLNVVQQNKTLSRALGLRS